MNDRRAGLRAVARLFASAADQLVTARVGIPPLTWLGRQIAAAVRQAYRLGRFGPPSESREVAVIVHEGEVIDP